MPSGEPGSLPPESLPPESLVPESLVPESLVGQLLEVEVGPVAHGGHCVARHEGRVVFVRHAIPEERVRVVITEGHEASRYLRADAVEVLDASLDRVTPPCPHAGPGLCGGCDFQHVTMPRQRELKAAVVREQLLRLARLDVPVEVESVPGDASGLGWRTRIRWSATPDGRSGLLRHRSDQVVPIDRCRIAHPDLPEVSPSLSTGQAGVTAVVSSTGERAVMHGDDHPPTVTEEAAGRRWRVAAGGFWQVHPGAADVLVAAVMEGLEPEPGERCWDLYAGVGLFSGALAERVGAEGAVVAVESHGRAARHATENLQDVPQVRVVADRVDRFVRSRIAQGRLDLVVLDPPRSGAGRDVVRRIAAQGPRAVAYVACDPAALARDLATFAEHGYRLETIRAFDVFPMTHHVECVALCVRGSDSALVV